jgi:hypothetical protein
MDTDDIRLAIGAAASSAALDELGRRLWRSYGQGGIRDRRRQLRRCGSAIAVAERAESRGRGNWGD